MVEPDRLYRNLKDWVTLDELDVEIHLAKEGVLLSNDSLSSEKFMHGIKVLTAKNYIDNLSEEARKGQMEKAEQGLWPSKAPLGHLDVTGKDGRKVIEPDRPWLLSSQSCSSVTPPANIRSRRLRRRLMARD